MRASVAPPGAGAEQVVADLAPADVDQLRAQAAQRLAKPERLGPAAGDRAEAVHQVAGRDRVERVREALRHHRAGRRLRVVDADPVLGLDVADEAGEDGQRAPRPLGARRLVERDVRVDALQPQLRERRAPRAPAPARPRGRTPSRPRPQSTFTCTSTGRRGALGRSGERLARPRSSRPSASGRAPAARRRPSGSCEPYIRIGISTPAARMASASSRFAVASPSTPSDAQMHADRRHAVPVGVRLHRRDHLDRPARPLAQPLEVVRDRAEVDLAPDRARLGVARSRPRRRCSPPARRRGSRRAAPSGPAGRCRRRRCRASGGSGWSTCSTSRCRSA